MEGAEANDSDDVDDDANGGAKEGGKTKATIRGVTGIVTEGGQTIRCRALATSRCAAPWSVNTSGKKESDKNVGHKRRRRWVSRGVWIVDGSAFPEGCDLGLLVFPPGVGPPGVPAGSAARVTQLGAAVAVAPRGTFVLHASVSADADAVDEGATSAEDDLRGVLEMLAETDPPVDRADPVDREGREARMRERAGTGTKSRHPGTGTGTGWRGEGAGSSRVVSLGWCGARSTGSRTTTTTTTTTSTTGRRQTRRRARTGRELRLRGACGAGGGGGLFGGWDAGGDGEKLRLFPGAASAAAGGDTAGDGAGTSPTGGDEEDEMDALLRDIPGLPPAD